MMTRHKLIRRLFGTIACMALLGASQARADRIYQLDLPSIAGTITTNGTVGTLSAADVLDWQISQSADTTHYSSSIGPSNSTVSLIGSALTATTAALFFDFSNAAASKLEFVSDNLGTVGGFSLQFCDASASSPCGDQNNTPSNSRILLVLVAPGCCSTSGTLQEETQRFATAVSSAVPIPGALVLFASGLASFGLFDWRAKRRGAETATAT